MKRLLLVASLAAAALLLPQAAAAQVATATLHVTASVIPGCTVDAATLAFGNYDPSAGSDVDATTDVTVRCTFGSDFYLEFGPHGGRAMTNGTGGSLSYELYRDAGYTTVWDAAVTITTPADNPAAGFSPYTVPVFGRIPASQTTPAGVYTDDVTMTVHF